MPHVREEIEKTTSANRYHMPPRQTINFIGAKAIVTLQEWGELDVWSEVYDAEEIRKILRAHSASNPAR